VAGVDDGTGGVANNERSRPGPGRLHDGRGVIDQTLEPLVANDDYQVQFAYNASKRSQPHLQVKPVTR